MLSFKNHPDSFRLSRKLPFHWKTRHCTSFTPRSKPDHVTERPAVSSISPSASVSYISYPYRSCATTSFCRWRGPHYPTGLPVESCSILEQAFQGDLEQAFCCPSHMHALVMVSVLVSSNLHSCRVVCGPSGRCAVCATISSARCHL